MMAAMFKRNPQLNVLPVRLAWLIQMEVNAYIERTGQRYAPSEEMMDLIYELCINADERSSQYDMTIWELAEDYLPAALYPAPVLVVSN